MRITRTDYHQLQVIEHKLFMSFHPSNRMWFSFCLFIVPPFIRLNETVSINLASFFYEISSFNSIAAKWKQHTISHNGSHLNDAQKIPMFTHHSPFTIWIILKAFFDLSAVRSIQTFNSSTFYHTLSAFQAVWMLRIIAKRTMTMLAMC